MKKLLSIAAAIMLIFAMVPLSVSAAAPAATITGPAAVYPGDSITVTFSISGNAILGVTGKITYNTALLTYVSAKAAAPNGWVVQFNPETAGTVKFIAKDAMQASPISAKSGLFTMTFKVSASAKETDTIVVKGEEVEVSGSAGLETASVTAFSKAISHKHAYGKEWSYDPNGHYQTCTICRQKGNSGAHSFGAWKETKPASETAVGTKERTCNSCGYKELGTIPVKVHEHYYGTGTSIDNSNHKAVCSCGNEKVEAHQWGSPNVITEATDKKEGEKSLTCVVCGKQKIEKIPMLTNHQHDHSVVVSVDGNNHKFVCSCGNEKVEAHVWDEGFVVSQPTETANGKRTFTCSVCKTQKVEEFKADGTVVNVETRPSNNNKQSGGVSFVSIILYLLIALAIAAVAFAVVVIVLKKKKKI